MFVSFLLKLLLYANLICPLFSQSQAPIVYTTLGPVLDASEFGPVCYQNIPSALAALMKRIRRMSEDCLFVKILVPAAPQSVGVPGQAPGGLFPILFWPSGGAYQLSDNSYDINAQSDSFISRGVIIVQVNTRSQTYGFWSTGQSDAPGNYMIWDYLEALKFVKANAMNFGGDPNRIVLTGQGAGAVTSDILSMSPLARGLWAGLIMMSESVFNPHINLDRNVQLSRYQRMATFVGCDDTAGTRWNSSRRGEILGCMRAVDPEAMIRAEVENNVGFLYNGPRIDGPGGLFPLPFEILARQRPNTPVMIGTADDEYAWDLVIFPASLTGRREVPPNVNSLATVNETCNSLATEETYPRTYQQVRAACIQKYGNDRIPQPHPQYQPPQQQGQLGYLQNAVRAGSAMTYWAGIMKDVSCMLANGNNQVYLYSFDYSKPELGEWWREAGTFNNFELLFFENFGFSLYNYTKEAADLQISDMWGEFLTNFAKCGNPAPPGISRYRWRPTNGLNYFSFTAPTSTELMYYHADDVYFWNVYVPCLDSCTVPYS